MLRTLLGIFILLHGLVHLWYVVLSQRLVTNLPNVGWTGKSWVFTNLLGDAATRSLISVLYILATIGFLVGGMGVLARTEWWRTALLLSAGLSAATILLFWDGETALLVEKGFLGFLISIAVLAAILLFNWPDPAF